MGGIKIDTMTETNFHEWRQRIKIVLALRDLDDILEEEAKQTDAKDRELALWKRRDTKASAIIVLTLVSEQLVHVSGCKTTGETWSTLQGIFQRKSLMNKMKARREFYTVEMTVGKRMLGYINRVRNLGENLKAMGGEVTEMDVSMSVLNGLTSKDENLVVALDAKSEDDVSLDCVKSRLLKEKRRQADKSPSTERIGDMALSGASYRGQGRRGDLFKIECYYCHKFGHISHDCPELKAKRQRQDKVAAIAADDGNDSDDAICVVGNAADSDDISKSLLVDSAASTHMCWMRGCFDDYHTTTERSVTMGDKGSVAMAGVGTVVLNVIVHGKTRKIKLEKVLHVPTMGFNLVSVGMMGESGAEVSFKGGKAIIKISDNVSACGTRKSELYHLDMAAMSGIAAVASLQLWHARLGHVNVAGVKRMIKNKDKDGLKCSSMAVKDVCEPCVYGKAALTPMPSAGGGRVIKRLQLVHSDLGGPMSEPSRGGALYLGTFTGDFSRWTDVVFLQKKSDHFAEYKKWLTKAQMHTGIKIKILRSDNGCEYVTNAFKALHDENGTTHQTTVPDTPQQNGAAERLNRGLVETARTMMRHKDVDQDLWADAIKTAVNIKNRVTSRALPVGKTPFELWTGNKPDVCHMQMFGSTCWVMLHKSHIDGEFGDKAAKGVFLGYPDVCKAYQVILDDGKVVKARSVVFAETNINEVAEVAQELPRDEVVEVEAGLRSASDGGDVDADNDHKDDKQDDGSDKSADDNQGCGGSQDTLRRSGRARRPSVEYWRPVSLVAYEAPTTYIRAVPGQESTKWKIAMDEEMEAICNNKTWRSTDCPAGRRGLKGKWVYKVKNEVDKNRNNTTRHKARLCFMGNRQIKGLAFNETFAPVAKFTIRCILAMTAANGWELHQIDIKTAVLNGDIDEDVYMEWPDGYVDPTYPDKACRLLQALYGSK